MGSPKRQASAEPLDLSELPSVTRQAARCIAFIEAFIIVPMGRHAGKPVRLRPWHKRLIRGLYARRRPQLAFWMMARQNGKSFLCACIALYHLCAEGIWAPTIFTIGPTEAQAKIVWNYARRMILESPRLADSLLVYGKTLENPNNGGTFGFKTIAPAGAAGSGEERIQGFYSTLAIADEVHLWPTSDVWQAAIASQATVPHPLVLGVSTPGEEESALVIELYNKAKAGTDPDFFGVIFEAPEGCDLDDKRAWRAANPSYGDLITREHIEKERRNFTVPKFRRFRLAQFTSSANAWLPFGRWAKREDHTRLVEPNERIYLAFDGSLSNDSTALVGCTTDGYVFVVGYWTPAEGGRIDKKDVCRVVADAFDQYKVLSMYVDPPYWWDEITDWQAEYGEKKVLEFPTNAWKRMSQACTTFYAAVVDDVLTHDGDPRLAQHLANCRTKPTPGGDVVVKESKDSPRKIDLAVGAVLAYAQAATIKARGKRTYVF